jgi:hypothetical protein
VYESENENESSFIDDIVTSTVMPWFMLVQVVAGLAAVQCSLVAVKARPKAVTATTSLDQTVPKADMNEIEDWQHIPVDADGESTPTMSASVPPLPPLTGGGEEPTYASPMSLVKRTAESTDASTQLIGEWMTTIMSEVTF